MFTVYGINGRIYSGSLDGLRGLAPVQAVARLRAVAPVRPRSADTPIEIEPGVLRAEPNPDAALMALGTPDPLPRDALAAYAKAQARVPADGPRNPLRLVEELMSRTVVTVPQTALLSEGLRLLTQARVGQAPVVNAAGHLVGLLLRGDVLPTPPALEDPAAWTAWLQRPVAEMMWTPVPSAHPDTPLREVAQVLLEFRLPGLPVLDDASNLIGFLSRSDILRALTREPPVELWG
ncbi:CBS domain-containing protein [Roseateles koreensis]|uniref:CBS domain-containing protein n=1 Tax=Roseateles koreensis TaxID=2987526 RepID=A0ABT5KR79_9BURK|nr:CBS domain-containing protein [Roseateles koreensis]MDC8785411.1 CBS domain-containing protein [Roseateles koreensis]